MNLTTYWLALLLPCILFQSNSNGFAATSAQNWNYSNPRSFCGIGTTGRKASTTTTSKWMTSFRGRTQLNHSHRRTAFIQSDETMKTTYHATSSTNDDDIDTLATDHNDDDDDISMDEKSHGSVHGDAIQVSAAIELPFPKIVAYNAFSDLSRQSSYSPWLKSVEYIEGERNTVGSKTRWRMSYLGLRFTWNSISTLQDPQNGIIEWESITGLQNNGRVTFQELSDNRTYMNMTMSFAIPRLAAKLLGANKLTSIVEKRILETTVRNFRQIVIDNDWKLIQREQQLRTDQQQHELVTNAAMFIEDDNRK